VHAGRVRRQHEPTTGLCDLIADRHAALDAVAGRQHVERQARRQRVEDLPHLASTKPFFFMLRPACTFLGQPVLADCARANSSGDCVPSPIGSVAFM
jgi:hypothetical protein